ncbi:MAG: SPOR domain-containing protein [Flavobacteriales bacterium]
MIPIGYRWHLRKGFFLSLLLLPVLSGAQKDTELAISRNVNKKGERQYMVTVTVQKGALKGYAKLEEMVPNGFVATKKETQSAKYIFKDGKAKFIWMEFPQASKFKVSYKLVQKKSEPGSYTIDGRLSCVPKDQLLRVKESTTFEVKAPKKLTKKEEGRTTGKGPQAHANGGKKPTSKEKEKTAGDNEVRKGRKEEKENRDSDQSDQSEKASDPEQEKEPAWKSGEKGSSGTASGSNYFSVQIGAFGEKKSPSYFKSRYGLESDEVNSYREGGLYKYITGRFGTYDQARKEKKRLRSKGLKGAFVVGFKDGNAVKASSLR